MRSFGIFFVLVAFIALTLASRYDEDYESSFDDGSRKVVYVEKESGYNRPNYKIVQKEPEYKKVVYKYNKPEERKVLVNVKVVKQPEQDRDVVYKYVEKKYGH